MTLSPERLPEEIGMLGATLRNDRYKLIRQPARLERGEVEQCFDLVADPWEQEELLADADAPVEALRGCAELRGQMLALVCSEVETAWEGWCR